ncbi:uncharacterized protein BO80DRAFT_257590 [Aspergillus ibericus CBS 121593]|uniref:Secreted protein n=1 Tax=Aspergillus ibericus CBS 121593 TaxID=1448316 RepID=A0A395H9K9_9EURO|nr:hypothetical protein BO80DRAFT_257590 [Aspergillus ibericus CBS 121593]RAL04183.1 hypothetical protein BO80DRAFT_257590 [Aspergillus ibericus CBS 121593]
MLNPAILLVTCHLLTRLIDAHGLTSTPDKESTPCYQVGSLIMQYRSNSQVLRRPIPKRPNSDHDWPRIYSMSQSIDGVSPDPVLFYIMSKSYRCVQFEQFWFQMMRT